MFHHNHLICSINPEFNVSLAFTSLAQNAFDSCLVSFTTKNAGDTRIKFYIWTGEWTYIDEFYDATQTTDHSHDFTPLTPANLFKFDCYSSIGSAYTVFGSARGYTPQAHMVEIIE